MIYIISFTAALVMSLIWINGIDYMHTNYPDYKGEDLFDEDLEDNNTKDKDKDANSND